MASGDTTAGWLLLDRYHSHALESAPSISPQKTRLTWYREFLSWPDSALAQEPDLCLSAAFSSYYSKDLDHIERPLRLAEQAFLARDDKPALGRAHAIRSLVYRYRGSADLAIDEGKHALDNLPTDLNWFRGSALLSQSFGFYLNGDAGSSPNVPPRHGRNSSRPTTIATPPLQRPSTSRSYSCKARSSRQRSAVWPFWSCKAMPLTPSGDSPGQFSDS